MRCRLIKGWQGQGKEKVEKSQIMFGVFVFECFDVFVSTLLIYSLIQMFRSIAVLIDVVVVVVVVSEMLFYNP